VTARAARGTLAQAHARAGNASGVMACAAGGAQAAENDHVVRHQNGDEERRDEDEGERQHWGDARDGATQRNRRRRADRHHEVEQTERVPGVGEGAAERGAGLAGGDEDERQRCRGDVAPAG